MHGGCRSNSIQDELNVMRKTMTLCAVSRPQNNGIWSGVWSFRIRPVAIYVFAADNHPFFMPSKIRTDIGSAVT
jgi:hypothetical protein